jgi:putative Flp pilus-assembly TadE/G-like protein
LHRHRTKLRTNSRRNSEKGIIITLVAVFILFVVGAMAALAIDVVTFYTARSEAQAAADGAALAGARVLANSGITSDPSGALLAAGRNLASAVATQAANQNKVGGIFVTVLNLNPPISFGGPWFNPTITVSVQSDLPTFFARIWGRTQVTVRASATAEAYNPSGASSLGGTATPVAPICVKPWLLPNMDPSNGGAQIFDPASGAINVGSNLLGWSFVSPTWVPMSLRCPGGNCTPLPNPSAWSYYPGNDDPTSFPHPTFSQPTCSLVPTPTAYQDSVEGCIQMPIACNSNNVNIDVSPYPARNTETADAVSCRTNSKNNSGDTVTTTTPPNAPIQFVVGADNPAAVANPSLIGQQVSISDSLVTVPVFNSVPGTPPTNPVTIIGFVQLFLNPDGNLTSPSGSLNTTVINMVGCGIGGAGTPPPILGNGASPVAVRLISPSS